MTPQEAYEKCYHQKRRFQELEGVIITDPKYSYYYSIDIIRGQWEYGEEAISKNTYYSYRYALYVIQGPFEKCHHIIFNSVWRNNYLDLLKSIDYDMNRISEWLL